MPPSPLPQGADLFGDIEASPRARLRDYIPGLVVAVLATLAAATLSSRYGAPLTLMALLIGLSLNFLSGDLRLAPGLGLAARELLRLAIVLIGARITFAQIAALGPEALAMVSLTVAATLGTGVAVARALGLTAARGVISGGATAICGGSAALALSATLGERRVSQSDVTLTLVGISMMSATALILYPALALALGMSDAQAGYMLGASVHDVAQAVGAGYAFSPAAGETATIVKLARVALLAPVLGLVSLRFPAQAEDGVPAAKRSKVPLVPWFVLGFFAVAGVNSTGIIPVAASSAAADLATGILAMSVAATAIRTPVADIMRAGLRPLVVIFAASMVSLGLSLGYALLRIG